MTMIKLTLFFRSILQKTKHIYGTVMLAALLLPPAAGAQQVPVEVAVPERVMAPGDLVEIRGTYSEPHTWDGGLALTRSDAGIWKLQLDPQNIPFEYKYVIVRTDGQLEWESGSNRQYDGERAISDEIRGFGGEVLEGAVAVEFSLDLEELNVNGRPVEKAAVMGERGSLSWELPEGATMMQSDENGRWSVTVTFPEGMPVDVPFKFAWQADGVWHWEPLPGHIDHLLLIDPKATGVMAAWRYNPESGKVEPSGGFGASLDDYQAAAHTYGETRRYGYMMAIELLEAGDALQARRVYDEHRSHYDPVEIDDFDFMWALHLAENGQAEQALEFIDRKSSEESIRWRKSYFKYLKGEVLMKQNRPEEARQAFSSVLSEVSDYELAERNLGYARMGMALSYMQETDPGQQAKAGDYLQRLADEHPDPQMQRQAWQLLAALSKRHGDDAALQQALEDLSRTGSRSQRNRSTVDLLEGHMNRMAPDSAAARFEELQGGIEDPELKGRFDLLRAEFLLSRNERQQALEILRQVQATADHPSASKRAADRLKQLNNQ